MEHRFEKQIIPCLRQDLFQTQDREQTQEVRIPDGMPDIGGVLAAWGQCVIRGKEWLGDSVGVSGGVMAWVLYEPVDGSDPRTVEVWLPLQGKWNLPETNREGVIRSQWLLRGVDARTVSARKMMVRANVSMLAEVLEPCDVEVFAPAETESDVQLLRRTYPAVVPKEAGERAFLLEEEFTINPAAESIVYCRLDSELMEQKVVGDKAVFRGSGNLHLLYRSEDGQLHGANFELPFSQFSELDRDYDKDATLSVMMILSNLEPELVDGKLNLKCSMVAQYLVHDIQMLDLVEDAYSPCRSVTLQTTQLSIPTVLDRCRMDMSCEIVIPGDLARVLDSDLLVAHPKQRRSGEMVEMEVNGTAQTLYYDENGKLRGMMAHWSDTRELPADFSTGVQQRVLDTSGLRQEGNRFLSNIQVEAVTTGGQGINMVTALEYGPSCGRNPNSPSLILRKMGSETLWELAKKTGSTVESIRSANGLTTEPIDDRILLIPIS